MVSAPATNTHTSGNVATQRCTQRAEPEGRRSDLLFSLSQDPACCAAATFAEEATLLKKDSKACGGQLLVCNHVRRHLHKDSQSAKLQIQYSLQSRTSVRNVKRNLIHITFMARRHAPDNTEQQKQRCRHQRSKSSQAVPSRRVTCYAKQRRPFATPCSHEKSQSSHIVDLRP